jgi:hypothetical protein
VVNENHRGARRFGYRRDLLHLAAPDKRRRVRAWPALKHFGDDLPSGAAHKLTELGKSGVEILAARNLLSGQTWRRTLRQVISLRAFLILRFRFLRRRQLSRLPRKGGRARQWLGSAAKVNADQKGTIRREGCARQAILIGKRSVRKQPLALGDRFFSVRGTGGGRRQMPDGCTGSMLAMQHGSVAHDGGDGMLENQLLLAVVLKQHGVLVKRANFACEFDSADQVYRNRSFVFADRIEKRVLDVLCRLIVHVPISCS